MNSFLIYGANGYTGKLIVEEAVRRGFKPTIAGRNETAIKPIANKFGLPYLIFNLDNVDKIANTLQGFTLVSHCAGPFAHTAKPMVQACLQAGVSYLDITGEIPILSWVQQFDAEAKAKKIVLLCGVGFDLVPTDCMALHLKEQLPDATHLEIAFTMQGGSISHGTLTTLVNNLGLPGYGRINGQLIAEPVGKWGKYVNFIKTKKFCMSIPWGDLFSAFQSTAIPNIRCYTSVNKISYYFLKFQFVFNPLLRSKWLKKIMQKYIDAKITGPTAEQNLNGRSFIYGKVWNEKNEEKSAVLECGESYWLTAQTAITIVQKMLMNENKFGCFTPAQLFGADLILEIPKSHYIF